MRIFVTGGSGFFGRHLIRRLCRDGHDVVALARSKQAAETVAAAGARAVPGDLLDPDALYPAMAGCRTVFHAAGTVAWWGKIREMTANHLAGTQNVVAAARVAGAETLIHVSAAAVISDGKPIRRANENTAIPVRPFGAYARTKAAAEKFVLLNNGRGLRTVAIRPPAIWGNGDPTLLPGLSQAVRTRRFVWIDRGDYPFSACHVRNVCEGAIRAMKNGRGGEAYFLTDEEPVTFRSFVTRLLETQGLTPPGISIPRKLAWQSAGAMEAIWRLLGIGSPPPVTRALIALIGGPVVIENRKAREVLRYRPVVTMAEGLAELRKAFGKI